MHILIFLILGLMIGSFLNVLVCRLRVAEMYPNRNHNKASVFVYKG